MKKSKFLCLISIILVLFMFHGISFSQTSQQIVFSAPEQEPYIGENLPNKGFVAELVTEAFKRVGYNNILIKFYPLARAKELAKQGKVDGFLPAFQEESDKDYFLFSNPFPGNNIVIFKKKSFLPNSALIEKNPTQLIKQLSQYEFGLVRGTSLTTEFASSPTIKTKLVADDLSNLDNLISNKVPLIVIDKYTAADLLVKERPRYIGDLNILTHLQNKSFHIAFFKKNRTVEKVVLDFNRGLKQIIQDDTFNKIAQAHGLFKNRTELANKKTIIIGTVNSEPMTKIQELSKIYEKEHKNIKLEWRVLDENILRLRLLSDLAISDSQFDIMTIGAYETPIWGKSNWLVPIKNPPKNYDIEDIFPTIRNSLSFNNNLYALPFYGESSITYYRKDLFEKAKLQMPSQPNYTEIKNFAASIHNPTQGIYGICLRGAPGWGANMAYIGTLINTMGGRWFDEKWTPTINTPEWHKALEVYKDLLLNYGPQSQAKTIIMKI